MWRDTGVLGHCRSQVTHTHIHIHTHIISHFSLTKANLFPLPEKSESLASSGAENAKVDQLCGCFPWQRSRSQLVLQSYINAECKVASKAWMLAALLKREGCTVSFMSVCSGWNLHQSDFYLSVEETVKAQWV